MVSAPSISMAAAVDEANPLLQDFEFPPFDVVEAKHVRPGIRALLKNLESDLEELERTVEPTWPKLVEPLEKIIDQLTVVWGMINHLKAVKDSPELRAAIEEVQPEKVKFQLRLGQSKPIYGAFKAIQDSPRWLSLSDAQKRIVESQIKEAVLNGVALDDDKREQFNKIEQELERLSQKFAENVLDATKKFEKLITDKKDIEGLPATALGLAAQTAVSKGHTDATAENGPWIITLDAPSFMSVMQHAKNRGLREEIYRAYVTRASSGDLNNTAIIDEILKLKLEKAKLLNYNNYAEVSMATKMATVEKAEELLETLRIASWDAAVQACGITSFHQGNSTSYSVDQIYALPDNLFHASLSALGDWLMASIGKEISTPNFELPKRKTGNFDILVAALLMVAGPVLTLSYKLTTSLHSFSISCANFSASKALVSMLAFLYYSEDMEDLKTFSKSQGAVEANDLTHWDTSFWAERLRESKYDINEEELRPFFSLPKVMDGLFNLAKTLFGIDIEPADGLAPVWNNDVKFYCVKYSLGSPIAYFYFDPYSRPSEKRGGAWMDEVVSRSRVLSRNGTAPRLPIAHMVCNQTPPVGDKPSLMTFREVETVFHEFGHALQHMLTKQDEGLVAGIRGIEWDAVELPSQFMENWETLMGIAKHYETGESLPEEVYLKLLAARTFRAGSLSLRQLRFASLDLELHTKYIPGGSESIYDVDQRVSKRTQVIPPLPEDRFLCGYAAGYYSYKWAEVLSADAFSAFEDAGLDNSKAVKETGHKFRETILALGGGKAPLEYIKSPFSSELVNDPTSSCKRERRLRYIGRKCPKKTLLMGRQVGEGATYADNVLVCPVANHGGELREICELRNVGGESFEEVVPCECGDGRPAENEIRWAFGGRFECLDAGMVRPLVKEEVKECVIPGLVSERERGEGGYPKCLFGMICMCAVKYLRIVEETQRCTVEYAIRGGRMVTTRSGKAYGGNVVVGRLPIWGVRKARTVGPRGRPSGMKRASKPKTRRSKKGVPVGCKGPCKTHTIDVIKTCYHDGRGPGLLSNIDRGDDLGQMEGRRIRVIKMLLRGKVYLNDSNALVPGTNICKIWIIKDMRH
ncbi:unnamed protein product [Dovyalis caffra]|uniref:oligopeptidase A n=1 Tax=Dovyalis caffra TaxID=77055 RepID=A0AAV1RUL5_9ROSI|nr:unnamed protein product [Dovyalis caffra]